MHISQFISEIQLWKGFRELLGFSGNRLRPVLAVASSCPPCSTYGKYCSMKNHLDQFEYYLLCYFCCLLISERCMWPNSQILLKTLPGLLTLMTRQSTAWHDMTSLRLWIVISLLRETLLTLLCGAQRDFLRRCAMLMYFGQIWANDMWCGGAESQRAACLSAFAGRRQDSPNNQRICQSMTWKK